MSATGSTSALRLTSQLVEVIDDQDAVGQAGEVVVSGLVGEPSRELRLLFHRSANPEHRRECEHEADRGCHGTERTTRSGWR